MRDLLQTLPVIERARGFRLYGGGRRFVDLWQCGGAAIMGHKAAGVVRCMKNTAERGLFSPLPSTAGRRFTQALERLFPDKSFKVYADWSVVPNYKKLPVWRPFCPAEFLDNIQKARAFRPILPFPLAPAVIVCGKTFSDKYPPAGFVSPLLLAAAARAVYDMLACPERGFMRLKLIKKTFEQPETQKNWRLEGIYIYPARKNAAKNWGAYFRGFADGGFMLPPGPDEPIILPDELSKGEEVALSKLLPRRF
ncbi:MAG: hypothetical protein LBK66_05365 [Spirochaetaceae bacterium]|jgi:hypothetical protein|nr:hypothetical protein [Spirochaetaceae bacterium]